MGITIKFSYVVIAANGYKKVKSAEIAKISDDKKDLGKIENINCDCICVSGFWTPTIHLASQSGNKTKFNKAIDAFVPSQPKQKETTIGSANGVFTLDETLKTSFEVGYELSKKITNNDNKISVPQVSEKKSTQHDKFWCVPLPKGKKYKRFLDFQNDVAVTDIELALREGYRSIEHVKRYTTLGMATDQGKTSNLNGLQLVSNIENKIVPEVGHTTFRPPYTPVTIGAIVGREVGKHSKPTRKSPMHLWHEKNNAVFIPASVDHLHKMRDYIGMVFQQFNLFPHLTAIENVKQPQILVKKKTEPEAKEKAEELFNLVGLSDKKDHYPHELSGGQQQRVAIARALAMEPKIMLFDEVTSVLDPELVDEVLTVLHKLASDTDTTMLTVTHEMNFAREFADRVLFFEGGQIVESGKPENIFSNPAERRTKEFLKKFINNIN
jgi:ABC-type polar amino acid transport system ATPase subunit